MTAKNETWQTIEPHNVVNGRLAETFPNCRKPLGYRLNECTAVRVLLQAYGRQNSCSTSIALNAVHIEPSESIHCHE